MSSIGNTMNSKYTELRDIFFTEDEKEYFKELMKNPKERRIHEKLINKDAEYLYKKAKSLIKKVEAGKFNEEQMEKVEYKIAHYLAAIEDIQKALILEP